MAPLEEEEDDELDAVGVWLGEARLLEPCELVVVVCALVVVVGVL